VLSPPSITSTQTAFYDAQYRTYLGVGSSDNQNSTTELKDDDTIVDVIMDRLCNDLSSYVMTMLFPFCLSESQKLGKD
jgi:hypothetical protein